MPETYKWARVAEIGAFSAALRASAQNPLVAVGSGGSLSVAEFAASLHQHFAHKIARAATPLEIISSGERHFDASFFLFSAGGKNKDILRVFSHLALLEPHRLVVLTARAGSPIGQDADRFHFVDNIELPLPCGKDGFLATNSLLAFSLIVARTYLDVFKKSETLPESLDELLHAGRSFAESCSDLKHRCDRLWERDNLVVLHSPNLLPAARDLESRFTEAALGPVQIADFRHFAHGRHHWLAKRGATTSVLALVSEEDASLGSRTLGLLPKHIPVAQLDFRGGLVRGALEALCTGILIAGFAGVARAIDPGRPGVPTFGRKIYNLGPLTQRRTHRPERIATAVARKLGVVSTEGVSSATVKAWYAHLQSFARKLDAQTFRGLVLDYDGTICDDRCRFSGPERGILGPILRLLRNGVPLAIATGRGDSVRRDLRSCIPSTIWPRVLMGYHNGSQIGLLSDDSSPGAESQMKETNGLAAFLVALQRDKRLQELVKCSVSPFQISIRPNPTLPLDFLWSLVQETSTQVKDVGLQFVRSAHSIDVLAPGVSKLLVVQALREMHRLDPDAPVLCVGDRGRWPGNDYELLSLPNSLSVDGVSTTPETCWNLASPGHRGSQALLDYLHAIRTRGQVFKLVADKIGGGRDEG